MTVRKKKAGPRKKAGTSARAKASRAKSGRGEGADGKSTGGKPARSTRSRPAGGSAAKKADGGTARGKRGAGPGSAGRSTTRRARADRDGESVSRPGDARTAKPARTSRFPIVGIGASAGGLEAFAAFFSAMPPDSGMAFVLVAHLDPTHDSILPELLQKHTRMKVLPVADGVRVAPDTVYVIPPNKALGILHGRLHLLEPSKPRGAHLPIDSFLRSLAQDQGDRAVGIILSGTGSDGTLGVKALKGEAAMVMAQSEESARYDGMPRSAIATGLVDYVLPAEKMPERLIEYAKHVAASAASRAEGSPDLPPGALQKVFVLLRARTGHDFSLYKKKTILRRVGRRMNVHHMRALDDYLHYLHSNDREVEILFKELLIGVTSFFRDPEAFEALARTHLPRLLQDKPDAYTMRVWVPGCSSGEEAYSVAIVLDECVEALGRHLNVQIFGTDIDADAIEVARAGVYPESIQADVSPERLKRYFVKEAEGRYRIRKSIRERLVFAPQSVIKDPPFTRLDLISCRNLLIYMGAELQHRLLPLFHYSLKPGGLLFLGSSETIGNATDRFATADKRWKLFRRKGTGADTRLPAGLTASPSLPRTAAEPGRNDVQKAEEMSAYQLVETILQESRTPPCAIVDAHSDVVYLHGRMGRYLEPAEGRASLNIVAMARPGLRRDLETLIQRASHSTQEVVQRGVRVQEDGGHVLVDVTVKPLLEPTALLGMLMVTFREAAPGGSRKKAGAAVPRPRKTPEALEEELRNTRETLQTTIEEFETSNEELQSTNEELQSTNEELETSKEELQSLNEESATVNAELQSRIDELSSVNDDLKNLLDSTEVAVLFLDMDLCVSRFTPRATTIVPLAATDRGRPIRHFASDLIDVDLARQAEQVLEDLVVRELEVAASDGRYFTMRVRPYRTLSNVIDGAVITFDDITRRKQAEEVLQISEELHRTFLEQFPGLVYHFEEHDRAGRYRFMSGAVEAVCGYTSEDFLSGRLDWRDLIDADDREHVRQAKERSRSAPGPTFEVDYRIRRKSGETRTIREIFRHTVTPRGMAIQGAVYDRSLVQG